MLQWLRKNATLYNTKILSAHTEHVVGAPPRAHVERRLARVVCCGHVAVFTRVGLIKIVDEAYRIVIAAAAAAATALVLRPVNGVGGHLCSWSVDGVRWLYGVGELRQWVSLLVVG